MRISDWSSDVCSSDLLDRVAHADMNAAFCDLVATLKPDTMFVPFIGDVHLDHQLSFLSSLVAARPRGPLAPLRLYAYETLSETNWYAPGVRSEEHTSELQSLMRTSYAVFCFKKK